jgi:aminopeptidase N
VYGRGPIFVRELANTMDEAVFDTFLQDYYQTYRWENARTADFLTLAEKHCNCQLDDLFAEQVYPR